MKINKNTGLTSLQNLKLPLTKPLETTWRDFLTSDRTSAQITKAILLTIGIAGFVVISAMAPNIFKTIGQLCPSLTQSKRKKFSSAVAYAKGRGYIEFISEKDENIKIQLTRSGKKKILKYAFNDIQIKKLKKWNGKWYVVIFDIPHTYRMVRDALREKLQELGFYQLQKSVWVYPYPCFEEVLFVAGCFGVDQYIDILVVEDLRSDGKLRKHFSEIEQFENTF